MVFILLNREDKHIEYIQTLPNIKMKIYLDNNIFIYLENGSLTLSDLEEAINGKIDKIFYSASHIQEALEIKGSTEEQRLERINKRLNTIENITKCNYLYENLEHQTYELLEKPVMKIVTEVSFAQNAMKSLLNFVSDEQKEQTRNILNIESSRINNYSPDEVVEHLNKKILQAGQNFTFLGMIEKGISYHPDGKSFGLSNRIAAIFELLDMLGYWKDKSNEKSNYARLWDSSHTSFAANCDYFISDDKRTRNKAKVVYNIYGIKTKVISSKG